MLAPKVDDMSSVEVVKFGGRYLYKKQYLSGVAVARLLESLERRPEDTI